MDRLIESGHHFILVDAPAEILLRLSDAAKGKDVLLFNVRATDEFLRQEDCRANVLHTAPDRAMLADALAQYLVWKKWPRWLLAKGVFPEDLDYLEALRSAAKRFGGTSRSANIRRRPVRAAPIPGNSRSSGRCRCLPKARRATTCWWWPTRRKCSGRIYRIVIWEIHGP